MQEQLRALQRDLESDALTKMLATPLRRCGVTHAVLPQALMFQLRPDRRLSSDPEKITAAVPSSASLHQYQSKTQRRAATIPFDGESGRTPTLTCSADASSPAQLAAEFYRQRMAQRRRAARRALIVKRGKEILRALRMSKHRCATCQPAHRPKFEAVVEKLQDAYAAYMRGPTSLRDSKSDQRTTVSRLVPHGIVKLEGEKRWIPFQRKEKSVWITLDSVIAKEAVSRKRIVKRFQYVSNVAPTPQELCKTVGAQLRTRLLQEARLLRRRITSSEELPMQYLSTKKSTGSTAVVRRIRPQSQELVDYHTGKLHGQIETYAALIDFGTITQDITRGSIMSQAKMVDGSVLAFSADTLFERGSKEPSDGRDEAQTGRDELMNELREIAVIWNKRTRRQRKRREMQQRQIVDQEEEEYRGLKQEQHHCTRPLGEEKRARQADNIHEQVRGTNRALTPRDRVFIICKHPWTTDLVASLWRLQKWQVSSERDGPTAISFEQ